MIKKWHPPPNELGGIPTWDGGTRRRLASTHRSTRFIALALRGVTLPFLPGSCPKSIEPSRGYVYCPHPVRIRLVSTFYASKPTLGLTVIAGSIPALRTGLGGLLGVDVDYWHSGKGCLVFDKRGQLLEVPPGHHPVELFWSFSLLADTQQVLKCNRFAFFLRYFNYALLDAVVDIPHPPWFAAGFFLEADRLSRVKKRDPFI